MTVNVSKPAINLREKLAELDKPTGIAGEAILRADTVPDQAELLGYRQQNVIINGDMQIAQRGTSITGVTGGKFMLDRWRLAEAGTTAVTASQSTEAPDGFAHSLKLDVTTADSSLASGDYAVIEQKIEGYNLQGFASGTSKAKAHTLSFWVRSNVTGTYNAELIYQNGGLEFTRQYTINQADTWEHKVLVFPAQTTNEPDYTNTVELTLQYWLAAGANFSGGSAINGEWSTTNYVRAVGQVNAVDSTDNEFYITGVQLVAGNYPDGLPFMHRSYGEELALCQRYFYKLTQTGTRAVGVAHKQTSNTVRININVPVPMRATPSLKSSGQPIVAVMTWNGTNVVEQSKGTSGGSNGWGIGALEGNNAAFYLVNGGFTSVPLCTGGNYSYSGAFEIDAEL